MKAKNALRRMMRSGVPLFSLWTALACSSGEPHVEEDGGGDGTVGTLVKTLVHDNDGSVRSEYFLSVNKKWTRLIVDGADIDPLQVNERVRVTGEPALGPHREPAIRVDAIEAEPPAEGTLQEGLSSAAPKGKVAVILVKDSRISGDPYTKQAVRDQLFDTSTSTNAYFQEVSYGQYSLSGDVFGWTTADMTNCDTSNWQVTAEAQARQLGFVTDNYRHLIFLYERQGSTCFLANGSYGSPEGVGVIQSFFNRGGTFAHEIGHNLGLDHASFDSCQDPHFEYVSSAEICELQEYNDPFDAMGYDGFYYHFNSYTKQLQGWLPAANVQTVTSAGSFTIVPQETAATALQSLLIPIPTTSDSFHVEMRKKYGFDNEDRFDGAVLIRRVNQYGLYSQTHLIDMTPDNSSGNAPLAVGQTFTDPVSGISIKLQSRSAAQAVVQVAFGGASCRDGVKNNTESDVDCGGLCAPCDNGQSCTAQRECWSRACDGGECAPATGGLTGQYYSGLDFNELLLTRTDPAIDFNWHDKEPAYPLPKDQFTVRWTAELTPPATGTYTFRATTDDGVRLWVGDTLVIDRWYDATTSEGTIDLVAGQAYDFKMEYFEDGGDASARLLWQIPGQQFDLLSPNVFSPGGCTLESAIDLGARTTPKTVPSDACVKITQYPSWWQYTNGAVTLQSGFGSFPVPFTYQDTCTSQTGSATFSTSYQSKPIGYHNAGCPVVIDLGGSGANVQLNWY